MDKAITAPATPAPDLVKAFRGLRRALKYLPRRQIKKIRQAFQFGAEAHRGQTRKSGEAFIHHPLAVAGILADMNLDTETIIAALLHDTIEDTLLTKEEVDERFGETVGKLVDGVTKLDRVQFGSARRAAAESFRKMLLAMSDDIRVILIKLADRLHNMRTLTAMRPVARRRIARETLDVYAPIAHRLGMDGVKRELQELGFKHLHPMRYRVLAKQVRLAEGRSQEKLNTIQTALKTRLDAAGIRCRIEGRVKTPYSIYSKMKSKTGSFRDTMDILGFRIVVDKVTNCYQALGVVHNLYKPRSGRFKDYIAIPKSNGYQALHTVLFGPFKDPIEIQIRTAEMDAVAESGIAAHWAYKSEDGHSPTAARARAWLLRLLDMQRQAGDPIEFLEHVKVDLFPDEVYVFTPHGDIKELPRNATVLDFAYAVHTGVGNHAVHAWVDKTLCPLHHRLSSGETVKIITAPSAQPRPSWLEFVVTSKARTAVRHFLKNLAHEEAIEVGHRILDKALAALGYSLDTVGEERLEEYLRNAKLKRLEELLADVALGNRMPRMVARQLIEGIRIQPDERRKVQEEALLLSGAEGHVVSYGNCCRPIPGDRIVGYLSAGKGIVVHRKRCRNVKEFRKAPDRLIDVAWDPEETGLFAVGLRVAVKNRPGGLATVATAISEADTNIEHVIIREQDGESSCLLFTIAVRGRHHLARVMRGVRRSPVVISVHRDPA